MKRTLLLIFIMMLLIFPTTAVHSQRFSNIREGDYFYHKVYVTSLYRNETWLVEYNLTIQELRAEYIRFRGLVFRDGKLLEKNLTFVYNFSCPEITKHFVPLFVYTRYRNISRGRYVAIRDNSEKEDIIYNFTIKLAITAGDKYYTIRGRSIYWENYTKLKVLVWIKNIFEYRISKMISYLILAGRVITNYGIISYESRLLQVAVLQNETNINDIELVSTNADSEEKEEQNTEDNSGAVEPPVFEPNLFIIALLCIAVIISTGTLILWRQRRNAEEI